MKACPVVVASARLLLLSTRLIFASLVSCLVSSDDGVLVLVVEVVVEVTVLSLPVVGGITVVPDVELAGNFDVKMTVSLS